MNYTALQGGVDREREVTYIEFIIFTTVLVIIIACVITGFNKSYDLTTTTNDSPVQHNNIQNADDNQGIKELTSQDESEYDDSPWTNDTITFY